MILNLFLKDITLSQKISAFNKNKKEKKKLTF